MSEPHVLGEREALDCRAHRCRTPAVGPGQQQRRQIGAQGARALIGAQQMDEVLARFERADVKEIRRAQPMAGEDGAARLGIDPGKRRVASRVDDAQTAGRNGEQLAEIARRGFGVGDDPARDGNPRCDAADEPTQRRGAQLGIAEQRKVMHGEDDRRVAAARCRVVRGVKHVDPAQTALERQ